jgi:hypothetical protein
MAEYRKLNMENDQRQAALRNLVSSLLWSFRFFCIVVIIIGSVVNWLMMKIDIFTAGSNHEFSDYWSGCYFVLLL